MDQLWWKGMVPHERRRERASNGPSQVERMVSCELRERASSGLGQVEEVFAVAEAHSINDDCCYTSFYE